uniref:Serine/threonine-protein phosphatase 2A regulatory subunit B'' subunit gamma n=1 Tax=Ascaris suum TaxID=6253 RepID=F1KRN3_ASCSU
MTEEGSTAGDVGTPASKSKMSVSRFCDTSTDNWTTEKKLRWKLREEARNRLLQFETEKIPSDEEIDAFCDVLKQNHSPPLSEGVEMIRYDAYRKALRDCSPLIRTFIPPTTFMCLQSMNSHDPYGRVPVNSIDTYLRLRKDKMNKIIALSYYDSSGKGFLTDDDLTEYISEEYISRSPSLCMLEACGSYGRNYYLTMAVRKFFFFLDPMHHRRIRIIDVVSSGFLEELESVVNAPEIIDEEDKSSECVSSTLKSDEPPNWFSKANCQQVADLYLQLDSDGNGLLSFAEMSDFRHVTNAFMQRVFEVHQSYENSEIDLRGFCDLLLAMNYKDDPVALTYYFRALDVNEDGYLDSSDLAFFYSDLADLYNEYVDGFLPTPLFDDIKSEIFDICRPKDPLRISLKDLIACGKGGTIVGMLTDLDCLWKYENRDDLACQKEQ